MVRPYGAWTSPITADLVVASAVRLDAVWVGTTDLWWAELRPEQGGRVAVVRHQPGGTDHEILPTGFSARTRVHEYGGGAWWLHDDVLFFANWDDQCLYRFDAEVDLEPTRLTPLPDSAGEARYADGRVTPDHEWVVCVREWHAGDGAEASNEIVVVPIGGGEPRVLVTGPDFVSFPRPSPDGTLLAWTQWDHPDMPWDATSLWVGDIRETASGLALQNARCVAGSSRDESIFQPEWNPDGVLHFISDRREWWNLYRFDEPGAPSSEPIAVTDIEGEVGEPQWVFGGSRYAFLEDGRVLLAYAQDGMDRLAVVDGGELADLETPYTEFRSLRPYGEGGALIAASPSAEPAVLVVDLPEAHGEQASFGSARAPRDLGLDTGFFSVPEPLDFASTGGRIAHALYYPPTNPDAVGPPDELPPLIVTIHGGPTSAARPTLDLRTQYWTSRGFGVLDVNHGGSTGYGRSFRRLLDGQWGVVDVDDCISGARHLVSEGLVDPERLIIRGGSAGGYTSLCAHTFHDLFTAGAIYYGIADLEALAHDTHKFEAHYTDTLVGPLPEARQVYVDRSPIHHTEGLGAPLIIFQGDQDVVVPMAQAQVLVDALRTGGVPHAYVVFEGEQHGFRRAENIKRALEAELYFYSRVFAFDPPDGVSPVPIENLA